MCVCVYIFKSVSRSVMSDSMTPWIIACQAPLSMGFSRREYWSGLPCPSAGDLLDPRSLTSQADCLPFELPGKPIYIKKLDQDMLK